MAVVTKGNDGKEPMADDDDRSEREEREAERREEAREDAARGAAPSGTVGGGLFSLYKPGQGYWTRMGTAGGTVLLIGVLARFIYTSLNARTKLDWIIANGIEKPGFPTIKLIIAAIFCAVTAGVSWYYLNQPKVVDFFIATESEMKKVNWTSRKEIVGSTKVVISFMFIMALFLFFVDLFFAWLFWMIKVLHKAPFT
jgi:preprotein translocase SecE subunit